MKNKSMVVVMCLLGAVIIALQVVIILKLNSNAESFQSVKNDVSVTRDSLESSIRNLNSDLSEDISDSESSVIMEIKSIPGY